MGVRRVHARPDAHFFLSHSIGGTNRFPCLFACHSHRSTCQCEFRVPKVPNFLSAVKHLVDLNCMVLLYSRPLK